MKRVFSRALLCLAVSWSLLAQADDDHKTIERELQQKFVGHVGVLRGFYTDSKLQFDASGQPIGSPAVGLGPIDGSFYFAKIAVHGNEIELSGDSAIPVWNPTEKSLSWHSVPFKRTVTIGGGEVKDAAEAERRVFSVFFRAGEPMTANCTEKEKERFNGYVDRGLQSRSVVSAKPPAKDDAEPAHAIEEVPRLCFPTGEAAYIVRKGVVAPKSKRTPDPSYSNLGIDARVSGFVDVTMIVNSRGQPSSVLMVGKPLGAGLDEQTLKALRNWSFEPATFDGKPVPAATFVEFHFGISK